MASESVGRLARLMAALCLALSMSGPAWATPDVQESGPEASEVFGVWDLGAKVFDVAVLRPLGFGATIGGFPFFVVSAPLVAGSWGVEASWDVFVLAPADYTFRRPLGDF